MLIKSHNIENQLGISHGFFTRNGGASEGIYKSLNAGGRGTGDKIEYVDENRKRIADKFKIPSQNLLNLYQIHSDKVIRVSQIWDIDNRPEGDAMVTNKPGIALGILTADCVPILFADPVNKIIGAAHAGWKGVIGGIIENTILAMEEIGSRRKNILAAIGPAIGRDSYEVGREFKQKFISQSPSYEKYFSDSQKAEHYMFDIKQSAYDKLANCEINAINMLTNDTYVEEERFFSYRRSTHKNEPDYGRQISVIMLTN